MAGLKVKYALFKPTFKLLVNVKKIGFVQIYISGILFTFSVGDRDPDSDP